MTMDIQARIDGQSLLIVQGSSVQWHNLSFCAPGLHSGDCGAVNLPTIISTAVDGTPNLTGLYWRPSWPSGPSSDVYSSTGAILVPSFPLA